MHLTPQDCDKLILHQAGFLAQKRLARGLRLNLPEAVALIATQVLEFIREGRPVATCMTLGQQLLGRNQVMAGVPELVGEVQVEGTFPDGSKLVTVHHPIARADGDLVLALYGSFLPIPSERPSVRASERLEPSFSADALAQDERASGELAGLAPGAVLSAAGAITLNADRSTVELHVTNLADRPIQVGSHYHFIEANPYLRFDRARSYGMRLDIPAGTAVRFEPGETRTVQLVAIAGHRVVRGGNNLVDGPATPERLPEVMQRVTAGGFAHDPT